MSRRICKHFFYWSMAFAEIAKPKILGVLQSKASFQLYFLRTITTGVEAFFLQLEGFSTEGTVLARPDGDIALLASFLDGITDISF